MKIVKNVGRCAGLGRTVMKVVTRRTINLVRLAIGLMIASITLPSSASAFLMTDNGPERILIQLKQSLLDSQTLDTELANLALLEAEQGMTVQKRWAGVKYIELLSFPSNYTETQALAVVDVFQHTTSIDKVVALSAFNLEFQLGDFGQEFAPTDVIPDAVRRALVNVVVSPQPALSQVIIPHVPGEIIVRWKDEYVWKGQQTGFAAKMAAFNALAGTTVLYDLYSSSRELIQVLGFDEAQHSLAGELNTYGASEYVAYAQPDFFYDTFATPNDPGWTNPGEPNLSQIQCPAAWNTSIALTGRVGSDAWVVAVGDTGANVTHPDFITNRSPGWHNFLSNNSDVTDNNANHGSNVAAIIGAQGNNGKYMTGVDWDVSLLILKIADPSPSSSTIAMGIDYAYGSQNHTPAIAINLSLGSKSPSSTIDSTIEGAVGRARNNSNNKMLVVAAAGNQGLDQEQPGNLISPADVAFDNVIAVGAVNSGDSRLSSPPSNWGIYRVELGAPGENILGLTENPDSMMFSHISGTSQAAPHVTGVLELVKNLYPWEDYFGIRDRVLMSTDDVGALAGSFRTGGRLNARRALLHRTLIQALSTRGKVESGESIMIGGFIVGGSGSGSLKVALRGIGPSLPPSLGVPTLTDPTITLNDSMGHVLASNDDWGSLPQSQKDDLRTAGLTPGNSKEAALVVPLNPGSYTLFLKSQDGNFGVGLLDMYELSGNTSEQTRLKAVSTRCLVQTGGNVAIAGTIISPNALDQGSGLTPPKRRLLMRGLGPTLASFGVQGTLADPNIVLYDGSGTQIGANDQWADVDGTSTGLEDQLTHNGFATKNASESILWPTLPPGTYTTVLSGVNGVTGIALIEFYER
jgi:hypothetical protein